MTTDVEPRAVRAARRLAISVAFALSPLYAAFYFSGWVADEYERRKRRQSQ